MKKAILLFTALAVPALVIVAPTQAQDADTTGWTRTLVVDLTATQASYSDSWTGGEAGQLSWVGNLNGAAEKQLKEWLDFRSTLKLSFGQTYSQNEETKNWSKPKKSTDLIDWENVGRFTMHKFLDPYAAVRLETQFLDAQIPAKKRYLTPMKLTESVGLARRFFERGEDEHLTSRFGLAMRQIFTKTIADSVTYETENVTASDIGVESVTDAVFHFHENLQYTGKLTVFKAFSFSEKDDFAGTPQEDDWKAIDVNWENIVTAQITKIIAVNFYTQFLYDKQVSRKGRLKETLGIGFIFKMM